MPSPEFSDLSAHTRVVRGTLMGVTFGKDGQPDLSRATELHALGHDTYSSNEASETLVRRQKASQQFDIVCSEATEKGIDERTLDSWVQMHGFQRHLQDQILSLRTVIRQKGLQDHITPKELQNLILRRDKERTRKIAQGPLFHYHQTGMTGFEGVVAQGSVLSNETQMELGLTNRRSGSSRPDVVQFTRDEYSPRDGRLIKPGLAADVKMGGGAATVVLIFDESIMDEPSYDGTGQYPDVAEAPLTHLAAVAVDTPEETSRAKEILRTAGIDNVALITRRQWIDRYPPALTNKAAITVIMPQMRNK